MPHFLKMSRFIKYENTNFGFFDRNEGALSPNFESEEAQAPLAPPISPPLLNIAKAKKPHTVGEELIKPCSFQMAAIMCGHQVADKLKTIHLSDGTVKRRIDNMAKDCTQQLTRDLQSSGKFSIQLDETTTIVEEALLLIFVRYIKDDKLRNDLLDSVNLIYRLNLSTTIKLLLYYTLIYLYVSYCNIIWGSTHVTSLNRIFLLQKRAVRAILNSNYRAHTTPLFSQLKLLDIFKINSFYLAKFMFLYHNHLLPSPFSTLFLKAMKYIHTTQEQQSIIEHILVEPP